MKLHRFAWAFVLMGLVSCSKPEAAPGDRPGVSPNPATSPITNLETKYNIGDVEFNIKTTTQLAPESQLGNVAYTESETKRGELAMAEAIVSTPYPSSLWLISTLWTPTSFRTTDAIVIKQRVFIDGRDEPLKEASYVWTGSNLGREPGQIKVDLMPFVDSPVRSVLLYTRLEIVWFPDRDPATVDATTAPISPQYVVEKLSNTLRVTLD